MVKTEFEIKFKTLENDKKTAAIIVAAGSASRMGGIDKQTLCICGKPVIIHSLLAFQNCAQIDSIVLVTKEDSVLQMQKLVDEYKITKLTDIVVGGENRAQSVINGLTALANDIGFVLIHDGARPLVTHETINNVITATELYGAAAPAVAVKDTVKIIDSVGKVIKTPKRSELVSVQTPQGFKLSTLKNAIANFKGNLETVTDDCMFIELDGGTVYTVSGNYDNIKITTAEDVPLAENILKSRGE